MWLIAAVRRLLVSLRDSLDRKLHPGRQRRALRRLQAIAPCSVLFVCLGNVCRSPYGERVLSERGGTSLEVDSAGFIGPDRLPPDNAIAVARARGIEHGDHRSKTLTPVLLEAADVIFVFDRHNARRVLQTPGARPERIYWLGDFDPTWAGKRAIADPWGRPIEDFDRTFERIERCVDEVVRALVPPRRDA